MKIQHPKQSQGADSPVRLKASICGAVQGVGFRPFIYRLATELGVAGFVQNSSQGVTIEVEGTKKSVEQFVLRVEREKPPRSYIQSFEYAYLDPKGLRGFEIRESDPGGEKTALVLPDIATCPDCLHELFDPRNRRYRYPFTNCTHCGPRYTIIEALPYDRRNTSMKKFKMCPECEREYHDPLNRRFHAQPNACWTCGPQLELWNTEGRTLESREGALMKAAQLIREGAIVAVKGLGGFHLIADARNDEAVRELRRRKGREEKPFALMAPRIEFIKEHGFVSELEERVMLSSECPIVLVLRKMSAHAVASAAVAPGNPCLGVMLPYTPLHHLLMKELGFAVVATSGNVAEEPISTDEREALMRLGAIADAFLVHNRPILRHVDDSIVRVVMNRELVLRRSRGYAPLPVHFRESMPALIAVGAHLKNTVAAGVGRNAFVSQHIGDLETPQAFNAFQDVIKSLMKLYGVEPLRIACDTHPNYVSTQFARKFGLPLVPVQHHFAHVLACMAENELIGPVLGIAWDGTGYGTDDTVWGGEFLAVREATFLRAAHLDTFPLPGAEKAVREPRRSAIGVLYRVFGDELFKMNHLPAMEAFSSGELEIIRDMLSKSLNTPITSSAGRLFDAVASITGLRHVCNFEGQAAMEMEYAMAGTDTNESYAFNLVPHQAGLEKSFILDWKPMIRGILDDLFKFDCVSRISAKFHNTLAEMAVSAARVIGIPRIVLSGGCFQNKHLCERMVARLRDAGFQPYWHQRIPPNDGGIALGQIAAAALQSRKEALKCA